MKVLLTILVYNRFHNLQRWLYCWQKCNQIAELIVIHTGDEIEKYKELCEQNGVKYIHRDNTTGRDIAVVQDVFRERIPDFPNDWDLLLWLTDDVMPMRSTFIHPFIAHMAEGIAITAMQISQAYAPHVRTTAYCIRKEVASRIQFPADPVTTREEGLFWEHRGGRQTLTMQVHAQGFRCVQVEPIETGPLWDTGYGKRPERQAEHNAAFPVAVPPVPVHHFYHIYAAHKDQWQEPLREHVAALRLGLSDQLTTFAVGIVGGKHQRQAVKQYLVEQGIPFTVIAEADQGWEQVTLIPMHEFCKTHTGVVLYMHTKGAHDGNEVNIRWRRSMTYWCCVRWKDCLEKLKTYETVACHWIYPVISMPEHVLGNPMYGGNFWWARCELVATFDPPPMTHRHESEGWLGYKYVKQPWRLWDWTPYFPNTGPFADSWVSNPLFIPDELGRGT